MKIDFYNRAHQNAHNYKPNTDGENGVDVEFALELYCRNGKAVRNGESIVYGTAKPAGTTDFIVPHNAYDFAGRHVEIKTGAGELHFTDSTEKRLNGCSLVVYIPYVDREQPLEYQYGFVMSNELFCELLKQAGMVRDKVTSHGTKIRSLQTVTKPENGKRVYHGKKPEKWVEMMQNAVDAGDALSFVDFLDLIKP